MMIKLPTVFVQTPVCIWNVLNSSYILLDTAVAQGRETYLIW